MRQRGRLCNASLLLIHVADGWAARHVNTLGLRESEPTSGEILDELAWVVDRAVEHLGPERAGRYLRKFYPWYLDRLGAGRADQEAFQKAASLIEARRLIAALEPAALVA